MATTNQSTETDEQSTTMTAAGYTVAQTALGDFANVSANAAKSLIQTTDDGEIIYPDEVAGYRRQETSFKSEVVFTAPISVDRSPNKRLSETQYMVVVYSPTREDHYHVGVQIGESFSSYSGYGIMATEETELEAAEKAVEFMQTYPAPDVDHLYRPGDIDRAPCTPRLIGKRADRIRAGSEIHVDGLPPAQAVRELDSAETRVMGGTVWECDLIDQPTQTFHLFVEDSYSKPEVSYAGSLTDYKTRTHVEHLTVDNEQNLRESVNEPLYQWLKDREGETVIRRKDDCVFAVVELSELRDGFLNPPSDEGLDPNSRRTTGTYIGDDTDADNWFDNAVELPTGTYTVRSNGVVEIDDTYGVDPVISADEWDDFGAFAPTTDAPETVTTVDNPLPADRPGLSRDDDITDIVGIGPATAEEMWHDSVGELYDDGFPAVFAPNQYTAKIIADLYTLAETPTATDAARAVVGVLGGVGYDSDYESVGTAASMITNSMEADELQVGWLGPRRLKSELTPTWIDEDDGPFAVGAGRITTDDIEAGIANHPEDTDDIEAKPLSTIRTPSTGDTGKVALSTDDGEFVELRETVLQTAATIADVDLSQTDEQNAHIMLYADDGEGVVFISNPRRPFNVVIDTHGYVDERDIFECE